VENCPHARVELISKNTEVIFKTASSGKSFIKFGLEEEITSLLQFLVILDYPKPSMGTSGQSKSFRTRFQAD
jgi:hypothetical protein